MNTKKNYDCTIVVLGLHKDGRPRAAAYSSANKEIAAKAAERWKLRLGYACDDAGMELMKGIPSGLQHPFEKVDAPVIKREAYDLISKVLKAEPGLPPDTPNAPTKSGFNPWDAIEIGSTVLWQTDPNEGYFPCTVTKVSADRKRLTLKWIGSAYEKLPLVVAPRIAVGLIAVVK